MILSKTFQDWKKRQKNIMVVLDLLFSLQMMKIIGKHPKMMKPLQTKILEFLKEKLSMVSCVGKREHLKEL